MKSSTVFAGIARSVQSSLHPNLLQFFHFNEQSSTERASSKKNTAEILSGGRPLQEYATTFGTHLNTENPTRSKGLSSQQAKINTVKYGENTLVHMHSRPVPLWLLVIVHACNAYVVLLLFFGTVLLLLYSFQVLPDQSHSRHTLFMGTVLIGGGIISCMEICFQELKVGQILRQEHRFDSAEHCPVERVDAGRAGILPVENRYCSVTRDGQIVCLRVRDIVPGDLLHLSHSEKVPADCRVVCAENLVVRSLPMSIAQRTLGCQDQSTKIFSGECVISGQEPSDVEAVVASNSQVGSTWLLRGSSLEGGSCTALVVHTGLATVLGRASSTASTSTAEPTSQWLRDQIGASTRWLLACAMLQVGVLSLSAIALGRDVSSVMFLEGLIVLVLANLPLGLPSLIANTTASNMESLLANHNVRCSTIGAVDTIGSCSMLCLDESVIASCDTLAVEQVWLPVHGVPAGRSADGTCWQSEGDRRGVSKDPGRRSEGSNKHLASAKVPRRTTPSGLRSAAIAVRDCEEAAGSLLRLFAHVGVLSLSSCAAHRQQKASPVEKGLLTFFVSAVDAKSPEDCDRMDMSLLYSSPPDSASICPQFTINPSIPCPEPSTQPADIGTPQHQYSNPHAAVPPKLIRPQPRRQGNATRQYLKAVAPGTFTRDFGEPNRPLHLSVHQLSISSTPSAAWKSFQAMKSRFLYSWPDRSVILSGSETCLPASSGRELSVMALRGHPEEVVSRCSHFLHAEGPGEAATLIDRSSFIADMKKQWTQLTEQGGVVVAFAVKVLPKILSTCQGVDSGNWSDLCRSVESDKLPMRGLCFAGLVGLNPLYREEVPRLVPGCRNAGVGLVLMTAGSVVAAESLARRSGLLTDRVVLRIPSCDAPSEGEGQGNAQSSWSALLRQEMPPAESRCVVPTAPAVLISCHALVCFSEEDWEALFSRSLSREVVVVADMDTQLSLEQKVQLMRGLRQIGHVVSMVGRALDSADALLEADVGVSLGDSCSEAVHYCADIVLPENDLTSVLHVMESGRSLRLALQKSLAYSLSHVPAQLLVAGLGLVVGTPQPLAHLMGLFFNVVLEVPPAAVVGALSPEPHLMHTAPARSSSTLLSKPLLGYSFLQIGLPMALVSLCLYLRVFLAAGVSLREIFTNDRQHFLSREDVDGSGEQNHNTLLLANGQELSSSQQTHLVAVAQTMWLLAMLIAQTIHALITHSSQLPLLAKPFPSLAYLQAVAPLVVCALSFVLIPVSGSMIGTAKPRILDLLLGAAVLFVVIGLGVEWRRRFLVSAESSSLFARIMRW